MKASSLQRFALYIFFFSINFEVWDPLNSGGYSSLSKITGLLYLGAILLNAKIFFQTSRLKPYLYPFGVFFLLLTIISLYHVNKYDYNFFDFSIFQNIILFWILLNHERNYPSIIGKGLIAFAIGSVLLAVFYVFGFGIEYISGRLSLFGDNANTVGLRMSISIIIIIFTAVSHYQQQLSKSIYWLLIAIPAMLKLLAETGSRVAFASFILMFLFGGVLVRTNKKWHKHLITLLSLSIIALVINFMLQNEILMSRILMSSEGGDLAGRDDIWEKLIPLVRDNLFFGVGKTGYSEYALTTFAINISPHNVLLEVLCYTGIFGLLSYLLFLSKIAKQAFFSLLSNRNSLPLLLLIPVVGSILSGQILNSKISYIIFAYVISSGSFIAPTRKSTENYQEIK